MLDTIMNMSPAVALSLATSMGPLAAGALIPFIPHALKLTHNLAMIPHNAVGSVGGNVGLGAVGGYLASGSLTGAMMGAAGATATGMLGM